MEVICRSQSEFPDLFKSDDKTWKNPFKAGWLTTLNLLERELEFLGATYCVIELALDSTELRMDGWPKASAQPRHAGVIISFDSEHGDLRYGTDRYLFDWKTNVRAIALGLEKLRAVERYGIANRGEQYKGWSELPEHADGGMDKAAAAAVLAAYGGAAAALRATHPDTRGSSATDADFHRVQQARRVLKRG